VNPADRYELLEKIGAGSFATVYRARDRELGREVAIKQIAERYLQDPSQLERYWSESQLLASMQHPNIVTIYDVVRQKGWLVLELMQGNIRDRLQGKQMDLRALRTTLAHCLRALKYLHSRGVIHGDVKPSNMMIDHRKRVKIGDFGLARRVSNTEGSQILGTAKYMSPEMIAPELGDVGPSSDLYSLGFAAYELLCGSNFEELFPGLEAFGRDKQAAWMTWHAAPDRRLPEIRRVLDGVPDDLSYVIQKLIEKNPTKRYQDAELALADLKLDLKVVNAGGGDTTEIQTAPSGDDAAKRRRVLAIGAFALSTTLSLAVAFWPSGASKPVPPPQSLQGVVRSVDGDRGVIVYEDAAGVPDEYQLPAKPRIRLIRPHEPDAYILAREIQSGDWLEVEPAAEGSKPTGFVVSRPVQSMAQIKAVDSVGHRLMLSVERGRVRDDLTVNIPGRTTLLLNGKKASLLEFQAGDRIEVRHVIDPGGKRGHLASEVAAFRANRTAGFVDHVDAAANLLVLQYAAGGRTEELKVAPDAVIRQKGGAPVKLADLKKGDRLELVADAVVREIDLFRDGGSVSGLIRSIDAKGRVLQVTGDDGKPLQISVPEDAVITLQRGQAGFADLRPQVDRVVVGGAEAEPGKINATTIDATRGVLHDRWALVVGASGYQDRTVSRLTTPLIDARLFADTLVERYACDPEWVTRLLDPNRADVKQQIERLAGTAAGTSQLIVSLFGQAYVGPDGVAYLALTDFRFADMAGSGLPLDWVLEQLEACPAQEKILLLNVVHPGTGGDRAAQPALAEILKAVKTPLKTTTVLGAKSSDSASPMASEAKAGIFAQGLAEAYRGAADSDEDLRITADELGEWLLSKFEVVRIPEHP
jgi:tRNA A-37 threonylcarbamoyl transferase component Bud32